MRAFALLTMTCGVMLALPAVAANYTLCNTSACSTGGSAKVSGSYDQTRYPVVLAHGMAGFNQIGSFSYWYGIPQDLTSNGANVYVTQVAAFNNSTVRGEQLLAQVKTVLAISGAKKVNLVGHSQGTLDSRYVAAVAPQLIASVTGVGGPNTGSPVADLVSGVSTLAGSKTSASVAAIVNGFASMVSLISGKSYSQDALAGLAQLTTAGAAAFNASYPAGMPTSVCGQGAATVKGVNYYSWGGTSPQTNLFDVSDIALKVTSQAFAGKPNDGLVGQCSNHLGVVIRDNYTMNHLDEVNQIAGLVSVFDTSPVAVFRTHINRLKLAGL